MSDQSYDKEQQIKSLENIKAVVHTKRWNTLCD